MSNDIKTSRCKACGAEIIWIKTDAGKNMPIDAKKTKAYWQKAKWTGSLIDEFALIDVHIPHWATCPKAEQFRKKS